MKAHFLLIAAIVSISAAAPHEIPAEGKVYELPETGRNIAREGDGWINVRFSGAQMVVRFFDAEKRPTAPDVARATARFRYAAKSRIRRTVLNLDDEALVSPNNVRPPHNFFVTLTLLDDDAEDVVDVLNFKFP